MTTQWHDVARLKDLEARKKTQVMIGDLPLALFYIKGTVYALADICVHEQRPLSKGAVLFGKIICPGHQWKFDPETGEADGQDRCQPTFPVRVDADGVVSVSLEREGALQ
jgi:nitrite reductase (NADH) small subunit